MAGPGVGQLLLPLVGSRAAVAEAGAQCGGAEGPLGAGCGREGVAQGCSRLRMLTVSDALGCCNESLGTSFSRTGPGLHGRARRRRR